MLHVEIEKQFADFTLDVAWTMEEATGVLLGPSGSGKSLTLRAVVGLLRPDRGKITLNGRVLYDHAAGIYLPPQKRRIGYVPQDYGLFPHLTVAENIAYGLSDKKAMQREQAVREMAERMQLTRYLQLKPAQLSGGQKQRTALARALITRPELLVLDEPLAALDRQVRRQLWQELRRIVSDWDTPMLTVSHDLEEAFQLGRQWFLMDGGRLLQEGPADHVYANPQSVRVASILGYENILHDGDGNRWALEAAAVDVRLLSPASSRSSRHRTDGKTSPTYTPINGFMLYETHDRLGPRSGFADRAALVTEKPRNRTGLEHDEKCLKVEPDSRGIVNVHGTIVDWIAVGARHKCWVRVEGWVEPIVAEGYFPDMQIGDDCVVTWPRKAMKSLRAE